MLSSSLDTLLKVSKTTYPQKLFAFDCVTLYMYAEWSACQSVFHNSLVSVDDTQCYTDLSDNLEVYCIGIKMYILCRGLLSDRYSEEG